MAETNLTLQDTSLKQKKQSSGYRVSGFLGRANILGKDRIYADLFTGSVHTGQAS